MKIYIFLALFLVFVLLWATQVRERFLNPSDMPDPAVLLTKMSTMLDNYDNAAIFEAKGPMAPGKEQWTMLQKMKGLLQKYNKPEIIDHTKQVMHMDPGELARSHLGINN